MNLLGQNEFAKFVKAKMSGNSLSDQLLSALQHLII